MKASWLLAQGLLPSCSCKTSVLWPQTEKKLYLWLHWGKGKGGGGGIQAKTTGQFHAWLEPSLNTRRNFTFVSNPAKIFSAQCKTFTYIMAELVWVFLLFYIPDIVSGEGVIDIVCNEPMTPCCWQHCATKVTHCLDLWLANCNFFDFNFMILHNSCIDYKITIDMILGKVWHCVQLGEWSKTQD